MLQQAAQLAFIGVALGCVYGLVALGFNLIFVATKIANFAQGEMLVLAGFVTYFFAVTIGVPWGAAAVVGLVGAGLGGLLTYGVVVLATRKEEQHEESLTWVLGVFGLSLAIRAAADLWFGGAPVRFERLLPTGDPLRLSGVVFSRDYLQIIIAAAVLALIIEIMMSRRFRSGRVLRAVALNPAAAELMGINVPRVRRLTWIGGSLLGGLAGYLVAPVLFLSSELGLIVGLKGIVVAIIAGTGRTGMGVLGAGALLGMLESLSTLYFSAGWRDLISFGVLALVLTVRPQGLFGSPNFARV